MKRKGLGALIAAVLLALSLQVAWAGDEEEPSYAPMGGESREDRVRERARMKEEYEAMRINRALALKRAREETAMAGGDHIPGWKDSDGTGWTPTRDDDKTGSDQSDRKEAPSVGVSRVMIVAGTFFLALALLIRFRKGR